MAGGKTAAKDAKDATANNILNKIIASKGLSKTKTLQHAGRSSRWLNAVQTENFEFCLNAQEWSGVACFVCVMNAST